MHKTHTQLNSYWELCEDPAWARRQGSYPGSVYINVLGQRSEEGETKLSSRSSCKLEAWETLSPRLWPPRGVASTCAALWKLNLCQEAAENLTPFYLWGLFSKETKMP